MGSIFGRKDDFAINNKTKLKNILSKVQSIYDTGTFPIEYSVVFDIIKILADNINYRNNTALLSRKRFESVNSDPLMLVLPNAKKVKITQEIVVRMGKEPIITDIWNEERQISTLKIFTVQNKDWKEDPINHYYRLLLPMGLTVIKNGFHSVNAGIVKSTGSLLYTPNSKNGEVYDLSPLYETVYFDGDYYRYKTTKVKVMKSNCIFELGCIFEIGRIICNESKNGKTLKFPYNVKEQ